MMKKFGASKSARTTSAVGVAGALLIAVVGFVILMTSFDEIRLFMRLGWLDDNSKSKLILGLVGLVLGLAALPYFGTASKRSLCLTDEKVYGNTGAGLKGVQVELLYSEILSAHETPMNGLMIESVKGSFGFPQMDSPSEAARLINEKVRARRSTENPQ